MARDAQRRSKRENGKANWRRLDQIVLTALLWFIPMALFGFVGFQIAVATGMDPAKYELALTTSDMLLIAALTMFVLGGLVLKFSNVFRADTTHDDATGRGGRWDGYTAPVKHQNK